MAAIIPPILVVIACKAIITADPDPNSAFTNHENIEWATENSMMVCKREEIQLYDPTEDQGAAHQDPDMTAEGACPRMSVTLQLQWDQAHRNTPWRVWRVGCPTPMVDSRTGKVVGYQLPDCGHFGTIVCLVDSAI